MAENNQENNPHGDGDIQKRRDHSSIAPQSPATLAIKKTMENMPPKPETKGAESEVVAFRRLLHESSQEYNVKQNEKDRETLGSLSELQTRFLIDSDVFQHSAQLQALP